MDDFEETLITGIKRAMAESKVSIRQLSDRLDMPYRSLQNYLSGTTRMPAVVYVRICQALGIDNQFVLQGTFQLPHMRLWDVLWTVFGDALADLHTAPNTSGFDSMELHNKKQEMASKFAAHISEVYDEVSMYDLKRGAHRAPPTISEIRARRGIAQPEGDQGSQ